jgi:site-specific DNA-methyltransferase (adenine-specific)
MDIKEALSQEGDDNYNIVYADPPWSYTRTIGNGTIRRTDGQSHYPTMSVDSLRQIGYHVNRISRKNSALLLWATLPNLPAALQVMESWGFKYKTCWCTWVKTNKAGDKPFFGVGYYTRSNAELCLLGVKGKIASFKKLVEDEVRDGNPNAMSSICIEPPRQHSRKPETVRNNIVTFFGDVPRIELFAREQSPGWCVLGNQSDKYNEQQLLATRKEDAARPKKRLKKK